MGCSPTWILPRRLAILRTARVLDGVVSRRQRERLAVGAVNLRLKEEVGRQPLGLRRIDAGLRVADQERRSGGLIVGILDVQLHLSRGLAAEQDVDGTAEAEILRALADIEVEAGLALPSSSAR